MLTILLELHWGIHFYWQLYSQVL